MFGHWGIGEILVILVVALLLFGPRRLPEIGKALGNGIREFRDSFSGMGGPGAGRNGGAQEPPGLTGGASAVEEAPREAGAAAADAVRKSDGG